MSTELAKKMILPADLQKMSEGGYDIIQTGGTTRWVNLRMFQEDPGTPQGKPAKGNGMFIEGVLLDRQEIADDKGEENQDGELVRNFYNIRLLNTCPVSYKDDNKVTVEEIAVAGDVVAIGERSKLSMFRQWSEDGGLYQVIIQPHSRIAIGGGHTMWTFNVGRKILRPAMKVRAEIVGKNASF
jgi:hypothetical protein